jgi:hypothetical protein
MRLPQPLPNRYTADLQPSDLPEALRRAAIVEVRQLEECPALEYAAVLLDDLIKVLGPLGFAEVSQARINRRKEGYQRLFAAKLRDPQGRHFVIKMYSSIEPGEIESKEAGKDSVRVTRVETDQDGRDIGAREADGWIKRTPGCLRRVVARIKIYQLEIQPPVQPYAGEDIFDPPDESL